MHRILFLSLCLCVLVPMSCSKKTTDGAAAASAVDWKQRAREYTRNPDALRALVETSEANEARANTLNRELNGLRESQSTSANNLRELQEQNTRLQSELASANARAAAATAEIAAQAAENAANEVDTDATVAGIIFQVQLGAFAQADNQVDNSLATGNALDLESQDGLQKIVVSQYRSYESARILRDRLRQMGVRDAFVVAKQDGVRINIQEALELTGQQ